MRFSRFKNWDFQENWDWKNWDFQENCTTFRDFLEIIKILRFSSNQENLVLFNVRNFTCKFKFLKKNHKILILCQISTNSKIIQLCLGSIAQGRNDVAERQQSLVNANPFFGSIARRARPFKPLGASQVDKMKFGQRRRYLGWFKLSIQNLNL